MSVPSPPPEKQQPWETLLLQGQHRVPHPFLSTHAMPSFSSGWQGGLWGPGVGPHELREVVINVGVLSTVMNCAHLAM